MKLGGEALQLWLLTNYPHIFFDFKPISDNLINMKKSTLTFLTMFCTVVLFAQQSDLSKLSIIQQDGNWIKMLPDSRIEANQFFEDFLLDLGLDENYSFELISESTDKLGFSHYRYQEHFNGHPVEGGIYILHEKDGFVSHANGKLIKGISGNMQISVTNENGLNIAKSHMDSEVFYWEMPGMETLIKRIKDDPNATFYPEADLVFAQAQFANDGEQYKLALKYELYGAQPLQKQTVFVDAGNGTVLFALEGCHENSVEGVAETRYHGTQTIITDSISPTEFRLHDTTRGGGIETYDMNENVDDYFLAVDFIDDDNYWDNANAEMDEAATDAHWGAEMFYDYYLQEHDRDSYDGNGAALISYIHYDVDYFNAFWNGLFATYGDGDDNPLTAIDVVAHEFTHAVTEYSADLIYQNESGALNESFSDIFGTAVEFFALGEEAEWVIGSANFVIRDMADPNEFDNPDTYNGDFWLTGSADNGGVHINSGVQNFWFYLLSTGGSGVNDNGDAYDIDSLGMDIAAAIAYRNLTVYLTPSSNYLDARSGAIYAAEDLYGVCSDIALEVAEAWYAVGVGAETIAIDLQVLEVLSPAFSSCDLGAEEQMSMAIRLNPSGCDLFLESGDEIEVSYRINNETPIVETMVLSSGLNAGDVIAYDFETLADLSASGQYLVDFSVSYDGDLTPSNDELIDYSLTNSLVHEGTNIITFDDPSSGDSITVTLGANAIGEINSVAGNAGGAGFEMHSFGTGLDNVSFPETEDENFVVNPEFLSKMNICVDLTGWSEAYLSFDLRQTYSSFYIDIIGEDIFFAIAMRVLVDGEQQGEQFHPETNESDPYQTHIMDMSAYAGTSFILSFEGIHFLYDNEIPGVLGDKSLLDNIFFSQSEILGVENTKLTEAKIYPNPTSGLVRIDLDVIGIQEIRVLDVLGNELQKESWNASGSQLELDLSDFASGIYVISIQSESVNVLQKVVVE